MIPTPAASTDVAMILDFLELAATILVPLLSAVIGFLYREIKTLNDRIDELESSQSEKSQTLYGLDHDPSSKGLAEEVVELRKEVTNLRHDMGQMMRLLRRMNGFDEEFDPTDFESVDGD